MVYCGKPSRGCQMCRTRRIKCDETKPTCLQCQKSRRQCPGYKDDFDLVFRNETQATERRAKRATTGYKKINTQVAHARQRHQQLESRLQLSSHYSGRIMSTSPGASSALASPASTHSDHSALSVVTSTTSVPGQIDTSMEAQATNFFLSNWVLLPQTGRGYLDFLIPLLRTSPPDSHLSLTFSAVGLAALGNRSSPGINSKALLPYAAQKYAIALKRTNEALRDPILAKQDSTLASVLLLGLFEQITSCRSNLMGWGSHVDGAVALIKMRGKKQLRTAVGKGLFIAVRTQMAVNCNSSSKPPLMGTDFWFTDIRKEPHGQTNTRLNLLVAELRAEVNKTMTMAPRTATNMEKVLGLMRRAQNMEEEFVRWKSTLPPEWLPKTAFWEGDGETEGKEAEWNVYPGEVQCFEDLCMASVWNMGRVSRLLLSGIVVRCAAWICSPADYRETPEYAAAASLASEMLAEIISAVPYHLGWGLQDVGGRKVVGMIGSGDFAVGGGGLGAQKAFPRALGGFFALWPLFTVACSDYATDSQRRWANGRLRWITEEMGVNQAGVLSQFQLRLPSMVIKRDGMGISLPSAKDMAKYAGPTGNLPPAARPAPVPNGGNDGVIGFKIKVDTTSSSGSRTSSIAGGSPLPVGGSENLSSNSLTWGMASRQQQQSMYQSQNQNIGQQKGISHGQGQYAAQQYNDESISRYASSQAHAMLGQEPQMPLYSNPSSSYAQALNPQSQFQSQGRYSNPSSYDQTANITNPSTYSTHTISGTNIRRDSFNTNTSRFGDNSSVPLSNPNQHQQPESHPRSMEAHLNQFDMASRMDHLISMTSEENNLPAHSTPYSPDHSSRGHSPSNLENNSSSPQYRFDNSANKSANPPYSQNPYQSFSPQTPNSMEFKVESPPTSAYYNPSHIANAPSTHNSNNNHQFPLTVPSNSTDSTRWDSTIPQARNSTSSSRNTSLSSNTHGNTNEQDRLNWEIEMVGREATKGNELERQHFQGYLRDLGVQRTR